MAKENKKGPKADLPKAKSRRKFLKNIGKVGIGAAIIGATEGLSAKEVEARTTWAEYFQKNYRLMTDNERKEAIARLEDRYTEEFKTKVSVDDSPPLEGVLFGMALNIQKCIGCRRCVYGCCEENNQSRSEKQIQWIRVIEMEKGNFSPKKMQDGNIQTGAFAGENAGVTLEGEHYYEPPLVPEKGNFYFPIACMQCEKPPCVKVCPARTTYREPDGIVVIDYNWCIGCRMCITACPYWARRFNWGTPTLPSEELNPVTHYLGNRPRMMGVAEKCTFCLQRTRKGRFTACVEACPVGARKFGNLLDPESEVRKVIEKKRVFRLKAELNTYPKFFYFID